VKTFIVRVWTSSDPADAGNERLRGLVEQIGAGEATPFASEADLVELLIRAAAPSGAEQLVGSDIRNERRR
jgi:hypothetical protein